MTKELQGQVTAVFSICVESVEIKGMLDNGKPDYFVTLLVGGADRQTCRIDDTIMLKATFDLTPNEYRQT